ncbi:MAG: dTMP kinase [Selenomonadaceae bacterium]
MPKGKLITIEAGDGSGKATQTKALYDRLQSEGYNVMKVEYPDYDSDSSALVKMYLGGAFGDKAQAVDAYGASAFFAVDRYASFHMKWKQAYEGGAIIIADRYTTSNMVHQAVKLTDDNERERFLNWLWDFEFSKLKLPVPDVVVYLDMDPDVSDQLIAARAKSDSSRGKDIHEKDRDYLHRCHEAYGWVADKYGWKRIGCCSGGRVRSIEEIHADVYEAVRPFIGD